MSNISIKGHVTVQIEDRHGTIRRRVEADNMLAPVALSCLLFTGLNSFTTTFKTALGFGGTIAQSQQVSLAGSPVFGIYAMNETFDWAKHTIKPPYVHEDLATLSNKVAFYSSGDNISEVANLMGRVMARSHFAGNAATFHTEYVKATGQPGTIKSVGVGTAHHGLLSANQWGLVWNDSALQPFFTVNRSRSPIGLEHRLDRTILYYAPSTTTQYDTYDLVSKETIINAGTSAFLNGTLANAYLISTSTSGIKYAFQASNSGNPTTTVHNIALSVWTHVTGTGASRVLTTPVGGATLNTSRHALPMMVMRPDTQNLEIFLSLDFNAAGCRLIKAVIDANEPGTGAVQWVEMGRIPYVIGAQTTERMFGYYDVETGTYWFPYTGSIDAHGDLNSCSTTNFTPGVKLRWIDDAFEVDDYYIATVAASSMQDIVKTSNGLAQGTFRTPTASMTMYRAHGVLFSGVNLPTPVHRNADDVLRLIYTYQLGNT